NVQEGRLYFSTEPRLAEEAMARVKAVADVPVFAKLSPNVTDITEIAKAAERGGADGFTAINTLIGMAVDWRARAPVLGRTIGGLSGPAIRPVALRMVYQLSQVTDLPIIGVGGIATADDVLQFLAAGASAVQVGTANFVDPSCMTHILDQLEELLAAEHLTVSKVVRSLRRPPAPSTEVLGG
ncbi:MAG: nitronate monooxygenase, partial [Planctomycetota bacterium]